MFGPSRRALFVLGLICGLQGCAESESDPPVGPLRPAHPDYDGDGYADLAVGSPLAGAGRGRVDLFRGGPTGPADVASHTVWGPTVWAGFGGALRQVGDIDLDGNDDLVVAESDGNEYLVRGGRDVLAAPERLITRQTRGGGDLDADGIPDLVGVRVVAGSASPDDAVWIRGGGPIDAAQDLFPAEAMVIADLSGDGISDLIFGFEDRLEVVLGGRSFPGAPTPLGVWRAFSSSCRTSCASTRLLEPIGRFIDSGDAVFVGDAVWAPSGADTAPREITSGELGFEPYSHGDDDAAAVGDLDGDGFDDFILNPSGAPAQLLSGGTEPTRGIELPRYASHVIRTGIDFDADGRSELVGSGAVWLGELGDAVTPRPLVVADAFAEEFSTLLGGDFDGDGDDDLIDGWNRFEGLAEGWPLRASAHDDPLLYGAGAGVADFDGDGDDDVYAAGFLRRGGVDGLESPGAAVAEVPAGYAIAGEIDLAGDARPDLVFFQPGVTSGPGWVMVGGASGLGVPQPLPSEPSWNYLGTPRDAGDVDGDGRGDMMFLAQLDPRAGGPTACVVLSASGAQIADAVFDPLGCLPVGDVDGDGRVDVFQRHALISYIAGAFVARPVSGLPPSDFMVRPRVAGRRGPAEWLRVTGDILEVTRLDPARGFVVEHSWPIPASLGPIVIGSVLVADSNGDGNDEYVVFTRLQSGASALVVSDDGASFRELFATTGAPAPIVGMANRFASFGSIARSTGVGWGGP